MRRRHTPSRAFWLSRYSELRTRVLLMESGEIPTRKGDLQAARDARAMVRSLLRDNHQIDLPA